MLSGLLALAGLLLSGLLALAGLSVMTGLGLPLWFGFLLRLPHPHCCLTDLGSGMIAAAALGAAV